MSIRSPSSGGPRPPLALIAGPTASGKSGLALDLADRLAEAGRTAVIINADSMQVYADIPVLSAAPDAAERARHSHRLYGDWDGAVACSAPDWAAQAKKAIDAAHADDEVPILVGGTGMYLAVLLDGIAPIPVIAPEVRDEVRQLPVAEAFAALRLEDPESAARLRPKDGQRIARALEVVRSTGEPLHRYYGRREGGMMDRVALHPVRFLPERSLLVERSAQRFEHMVEAGALREVAALLARDLDPNLPVMRAIGVRELAAHLRGEASLEQAQEQAQIATRRYAKRQSTWFRRQPPPEWPIAGTREEALSHFERLLG